MTQKLFTKSIFKLTMECPTKMYYAKNSAVYANQDLEDEFLAALAEGDFQVGEMAKYYYGLFDKGNEQNDIKSLDYSNSVQRTNELLKQQNVKNSNWHKNFV